MTAARSPYQRSSDYKPFVQQTLAELFDSHSDIKKVAVKCIMPQPGETVIEQRKRLSRLGWAVDMLQEISDVQREHFDRLSRLMTPDTSDNVVAMHHGA